MNYFVMENVLQTSPLSTSFKDYLLEAMNPKNSKWPQNPRSLYRLFTLNYKSYLLLYYIIL